MDNYVITINRTFGSGGKRIALALGKELGIPCYENEILDMASEYSGINRQLFYEQNEKLGGKHFLSRLLGKVPSRTVIAPTDKDFVSDVNLFNLQAEIIRDLAQTQTCIIVGKCAGYVLENVPNVFRFFVYAPKDACVRTVAERMSISEGDALRMINQTDKYRADYNRFYTGLEWTDPQSYDLIINSERTGWEDCGKIIREYVRLKMTQE